MSIYQKYKITIAATIVFLGFQMVVIAQKTRQQLEKEKADNIEKLNELRGILNQTTSQKRASLGQLNALKQQISAQNKKIELINDDLSLMDNELSDLEKAKIVLDKDIEKLRQEYAKTIYMASKRNNSLTQLSFLFSAPTVTKFMARYKYLKQYTDERQKQASEIKKVQELLATKSNNILAKKKDQSKALNQRISETKNLEQLKGKQNEVVKELSSREAEIRQELAQIRRENQQIESNVRRMAREIEERRQRALAAAAAREKAERIAREREARAAAETNKSEPVASRPTPAEPKPEPKKVEEVTGLTPEETTLASTFAASKGHLPWPVRAGFVSDHFGTKRHEDFNTVVQENQGVDIQTNAGENVRSVYDGQVMWIDKQASFKYVVGVQHGNFCTVYAKMKTVNVKSGQKIKAKDMIGVVATNEDGVSEVNFQIWRFGNDNSAQKINPELWLSPR